MTHGREISGSRLLGRLRGPAAVPARGVVSAKRHPAGTLPTHSYVQDGLGHETTRTVPLTHRTGATTIIAMGTKRNYPAPHESRQNHPSTPLAATMVPASRHRSTAPLAVAALMGVGLVLAGCSQPAPTPPTTTAAATRAPETTAPETTTEAATPTPPTSAPPTSTPPTSTPPTSAAPTPPAPAQPALCTAASLTGSLDDTGGGAAGSVYMKLILTNTSGAPCILNGYPGVSLVTTPADSPIGAPADWTASLPSNGPITLAPGQSSAAQLQYTQAANYFGCTMVPATSVMVYPPSATDRLLIAHPLTACGNPDIVLLHVGAFQP